MSIERIFLGKSTRVNTFPMSLTAKDWRPQVTVYARWTRQQGGQSFSKAFPIMLNFLYTGNLSCESKHIVALFWLADYFMIESLKPQLK
jgi:hypothetical protein